VGVEIAAVPTEGVPALPPRRRIGERENGGIGDSGGGGRGGFELGGHEPVHPGLGHFVGAEDDGPGACGQGTGDVSRRRRVWGDEEGAARAPAPAAKAARERIDAAGIEDANVDRAVVVRAGGVPMIGDIDAGAAVGDVERQVEVGTRSRLGGSDVAGVVDGSAHGRRV
jgi:hypothetical protein